ncbi:MAG: hypothetical protein O7G29_00660, partial [Acidobacteria bacterium]|nr:hypothetical protein [Acidobacteriota bacterium]
ASKRRSADFGDPCPERPTSPLSLSKTCGGSHDAIPRPQDNVLTPGHPLRSSLNTCCTSNVNPPSRLRGNDDRDTLLLKAGNLINYRLWLKTGD